MDRVQYCKGGEEMIWACMVILTVALAIQNKTISSMQYEIDWLNLQLALTEERIAVGEKDDENIS
jgi:hypothetical protein